MPYYEKFSKELGCLVYPVVSETVHLRDCRREKVRCIRMKAHKLESDCCASHNCRSKGCTPMISSPDTSDDEDETMESLKGIESDSEEDEEAEKHRVNR